MNYIKQLNEFYKNISAEPLPSNAKNLYETLLHINSDSYWRQEFTVANTYLILLTGLNVSTLQRARNTLIQAGYIKYKKGIGNSAGIYTIVNLVVQNDDEFEQQTDIEVNNNLHNKPTTECTTNRHESEHINKLNKTKQNKTKLNNNIKETRKTSFDDVFTQKGVSKDLKKVLLDFIDMRKAIKKPMTSRALELLIDKARKMTADESMQIAILNQSIERCWQTIYPLKEEARNENSSGNNSRYSKIDLSKNVAKYNGEEIDDTGLL